MENMESPVPPTSEERRADLEQQFNDVESEAGKLKTGQIVSKQQMEEAKKQLFAAFFKIFDKLGVDVNDPDSLTEFLSALEQEDPDLFDLFDAVFGSLENMGVVQPPEADPEGLPPADGAMPPMAPPMGAPMAPPMGAPMPEGSSKPAMAPMNRLKSALDAGAEMPPVPPSPGGRVPMDFKSLGKMM